MNQQKEHTETYLIITMLNNNMKRFIVEFSKQQTYSVEVKAKNEQEAQLRANDTLIKAIDSNTEHYHENGDSHIEIYATHDVTNTDD